MKYVVRAIVCQVRSSVREDVFRHVAIQAKNEAQAISLAKRTPEANGAFALLVTGRTV